MSKFILGTDGQGRDMCLQFYMDQEFH